MSIESLTPEELREAVELYVLVKKIAAKGEDVVIKKGGDGKAHVYSEKLRKCELVLK